MQLLTVQMMLMPSSSNNRHCSKAAGIKHSLEAKLCVLYVFSSFYSAL